MTHTESTATEGVAPVLQEYAAAWTALDLQSVADQWDRQDHEVTYIAEELGEVLVGHERISEHLLRTEHRINASSVSLRDVHVRELAPGLALATRQRPAAPTWHAVALRPLHGGALPHGGLGPPGSNVIADG
ncbi:hypothetical protein [Streptomyces sp. Root369]|uniref:hypothetical protein n=1 Tax=Streptomyces sp. Root369 TaxID=1736523 RepID=UPI000AAEFA87|nr:hypothetical protein [Streptomyces sp. Root369]